MGQLGAGSNAVNQLGGSETWRVMQFGARKLTMLLIGLLAAVGMASLFWTSTGLWLLTPRIAEPRMASELKSAYHALQVENAELRAALDIRSAVSPHAPAALPDAHPESHTRTGSELEREHHHSTQQTRAKHSVHHCIGQTFEPNELMATSCEYRNICFNPKVGSVWR